MMNLIEQIGLILFSLLVLWFFLFIVYLLIRRVYVFYLAWKDYLDSPATKQRAEINSCLNRVTTRITTLRANIRELNNKLASIKLYIQKDIEKNITDDIVYNMKGVPGIGPVLRDKIIEQCYNGTIDSLKRAQGTSGIGPQKFASLYSWIQKQKSEINRIMASQNVQNRIQSRIADESVSLNQKLEEGEKTLSVLEKNVSDARFALRKTPKLNIYHYYAALSGKKKYRERVSLGLLGVYHPWEEPHWLTELRRYSYE